MDTPVQDPRERGFRIDRWQPKLIDPSKLPDIEAIQAKHWEQAKTQHAPKRIYAAAALALVLGVIAFFASGSILGAVAGLLVGALLGFGIAHYFIRSMAQAAAAREIMPDVAALVGGQWTEDARSIVPPGNPVDYHMHSHHSSLDAFSDTDIDIDYGDGIAGRLPGHDLDYGVFNFTVTTRTRERNAEGEMETDTDTDRYIIAWLDLDMPLETLEVKRRVMKGGGAIGRFFDRVDSKVSDQNVLETESEVFNRAYKIEVPDSADEILVRRMFSPNVMDAFVSERLELYDDIRYRNGRVWIVEDSMGHFEPENVTQVLDHMLYRAQLVATVCRGLARQVGHDIAR